MTSSSSFIERQLMIIQRWLSKIFGSKILKTKTRWNSFCTNPTITKSIPFMSFKTCIYSLNSGSRLPTSRRVKHTFTKRKEQKVARYVTAKIHDMKYTIQTHSTYYLRKPHLLVFGTHTPHKSWGFLTLKHIKIQHQHLLITFYFMVQLLATLLALLSVFFSSFLSHYFLVNFHLLE